MNQPNINWSMSWYYGMFKWSAELQCCLSECVSNVMFESRFFFLHYFINFSFPFNLCVRCDCIVWRPRDCLFNPRSTQHRSKPITHHKSLLMKWNYVLNMMFNSMCTGNGPIEMYLSLSREKDGTNKWMSIFLMSISEKERCSLVAEMRLLLLLVFSNYNAYSIKWNKLDHEKAE